MVKNLEYFPLAVAQAAEYVCLYHTVTPAKYLDELKYAGLTRGKSWMKSGEYTEYKFPECLQDVIKLSVDKILQFFEVHGERRGWR